MKEILFSILTIAIFLAFIAVTTRAETVTLSLSGTNNPYTLSGTGRDGAAISFDVFCLDYTKATPTDTPILFNRITADRTFLDGALIARAQWVALQAELPGADRQQVIWSLFEDNVVLTPAQQALRGASALNAGSIQLSAINLFIPSGNNAQRFLIVSAASSISIPPAPVPEPASLFLLGSGLLGLGYKLRAKKL